MKPYFYTLILLFVFGPGARLGAQEIPLLTAKDSVVLESWIVGLGVNVVEDTGDAFSDLGTIKDQWNFVPFPSRISAGRYFRSGLGLELIGTYNQYQEGNLVEGRILEEDMPYWAIDSRLSYDLRRLVGEMGFFDPYLGVGLGYTDAMEQGRGTFNGTVGFRLWFSKKWGLDLNSTGKWSLSNDATNHLQHGAGVVRRFGIVEGLSAKGQKKQALIREMEEALQRRQDSIAEVERLAQARQRQLEQERLAREQEERRLAELRAQEAEAKRRKGLEEELASLVNVQFAFDSSYLNTDSKESLERVAEFMKAHPELRFSLVAHADSRGPSKYNQWLSERRADRSLKYLVGFGVAEDRIEVAGKGETELLNHCSDGVRCTAAEHAVNRRSDIQITAFE